MMMISNILKTKTTIILMIMITKNIWKKAILPIQIFKTMAIKKQKNNIKSFPIIPFLHN